MIPEEGVVVPSASAQRRGTEARACAAVRRKAPGTPTQPASAAEKVAMRVSGSAGGLDTGRLGMPHLRDPRHLNPHVRGQKHRGHAPSDPASRGSSGIWPGACGPTSPPTAGSANSTERSASSRSVPERIAQALQPQDDWTRPPGTLSLIGRTLDAALDAVAVRGRVHNVPCPTPTPTAASASVAASRCRSLLTFDASAVARSLLSRTRSKRVRTPASRSSRLCKRGIWSWAAGVDHGSVTLRRPLVPAR